ncbi:MAG: hypothetical protein QOI98_368, partial [Solirubrobacteraceae bacterium]|nr:hypothetical protein [Solirubrobacteraceae bacterium]
MLVAAMGYTLVHGQRQADQALVQRFSERSQLAAKFTASVLRTSANQNVPLLRKDLGGPARSLPGALRKYEEGTGDPAAAVFDSAGRIMASMPPGPRVERRAQAWAKREALAGRVALSETFKVGGVPVVDFDLPYRARDGGRRVYSTTMPLDVIAQLVGGYLTSAPAVKKSRAYLLDGRGRIIAATTPEKPTTLPADLGIRKVLPQRPGGRAGGLRYVAQSVPLTQWRVVFSAPEAELLAPVRGASRRSEWILFAAFVAILIGLIGSGILTLRRSEQLTDARAAEDAALESERAAKQLAYERLHDPLTGLPNRALFLDRVGHALTGVARRQRPLMVMFVDIDRFKSVNDSLGHAHGDRVLSEVARRLKSALRPSDTVARFGGDEFLVLCESIVDERDAIRIATRLERAVEAPLILGQRELHISVCIGIAI